MKIIKMAIKFTSNCCKFSTSGGTWVSLFLLRSIVVLPKAEAVFISCSTAPSTASPTAMLTWRLVSLVSCHGYIVCLSRPRFCAPLAHESSGHKKKMGAREGDTRPFFHVPTTSTTCILGGQ